MNIEYTENPLCARVTLNEHEAQLLRASIKIMELQERLYEAHYELERGGEEGVSCARRLVAPEYYTADGDFSKLEQRAEQLYKVYIEALTDSHAGDCTCFASSCMKCHAEAHLGINTLEKADKYMGHCMWNLFITGGLATCQQAIESLQCKSNPSAVEKATLSYLQEYQKTYL